MGGLRAEGLWILQGGPVTDGGEKTSRVGRGGEKRLQGNHGEIPHNNRWMIITATTRLLNAAKKALNRHVHFYRCYRYKYGPHYSRVMYKCLLVSTALAPGTTTIVCVSSMIIAGPSTTSPTSSLSSRNTGVSSTRPTLSK